MHMHMDVLILHCPLPLVIFRTRTDPEGARQVSVRGMGWPWQVGAGSTNPHVIAAHLEGAAAYLEMNSLTDPMGGGEKPPFVSWGKGAPFTSATGPPETAS